MEEQLDRIAQAIVQGRLEDASEGLRMAESSLDDSHARGRMVALRVALLDATGQNAEATQALDRALGNDALDPEAMLALGQQLAELGSDAKAERTLRRLCDVEPRSPISPANLGVFLGTKGRFDEAADAYGRAIERDPTFAPAYLQRAYCFHVIGDLDASVEDYRAHLALEPENAGGWDALGAVEAERGNADAAVDAHRRALTLNPEQPAWYVNAATTARRLGRRELLVEYAEALERLAPGEWHAALVRAYRQHDVDDFGAAWASYVEAFDRAEQRADSEGFSVVGHALLWYAITAKHTEVFDGYMRRLLGHGIFSEGVLAAIRAWHGRDSKAARSHEVTVEAARSPAPARPHNPAAIVADGQPVGPTIGGSGHSDETRRYRRDYQIVADDDEEAVAMALAFEEWCGGEQASVVSVTSSSDEGGALRGVYAASPTYPWGKARQP